MSEETRQRIGDYEILDTLGAGGMGKVFRVRNVISDRVEAMKILLPTLTDHREMAERFMREIKLVASLHHPNIANLCTAQMLDNHLVMVMEFVEGDTFSDLLDQRAVPFEYALGYFDQALAALAYAHSKGIVHRDIKPSNIMLTPDGVVKLMDFGIARASTDRALTQTGATIGTVNYMSPEQIAGRPTDARSDLYSMGILLYETITSEQPFKGTSDYELMAAHMNQNPRPPIERVPGIPSELNDIILTLLAKDPDKRFQSAEDTRKALKTVNGFNDTRRGVPTRPVKTMPVPLDSSLNSASGMSMAPRREATVVERMPQFQTGPIANRMPTIFEPQFPATMVQNSHADRQATVVAGLPSAMMPEAAALVIRKKGFARHPMLYSAAGLVLVAGAVAVPLVHSRSNNKNEDDNGASHPVVATGGGNSTSAASGAGGGSSSKTTAGTPGGSGAGSVPPRAGTVPPGAGGAGKLPLSAGVAGRPGAMPSRMPPGGGGAAPGGRGYMAAGGTLTVETRTASGGTAAAGQPVNTPPPISEELKKRLDGEETEIDRLEVRASSINSSLNTMKRSMEGQGVNMRGDIANRQASMNLNISKAKQAWSTHDADRTERFVTQAQADADELEKFLGR